MNALSRFKGWLESQEPIVQGLVLLGTFVAAGAAVVGAWAGVAALNAGDDDGQESRTTESSTTLLPPVRRGATITSQEIERFKAALIDTLAPRPNDELLERAVAAAADICQRLDGAAAVTSSSASIDPSANPFLDDMVAHVFAERAFEEFERSYGLDQNWRVVVLTVAGNELCPEHRETITAYVQALPPRS